MKVDRYRFLILALIALFALGSLLPAQEINEKVWSISYWQNLAEKGLVTVTPPDETQQPTQIPDSRIFAKSVLTDDSPDVPVTTATNVTQSENSIFVNPLDDEKLLNSNNSSNLPVSTIFGASYYLSDDAGLTWTGSEQGAGGPNSGDPATAIDLSGRYYIGYIADNSGQGVAYSTNEGQTWTDVQIANTSFGGLLDKNHMWVDDSPTSPYEGNLYSAWSNLDGGTNENEIEISRSTNGGLNWSTPVNISSGTLAGSHNQGVNVQTGPNGEVYAAWAVYDAFPALETALGFAKSTDGGVTWAPASRIITNIRGIRSQAAGGGLGGGKTMRTATFPSMTVSSGGDIYIVWTNIGVPGVNTGDPDNYMIKSTDGGATWGTPIRVNQDPIGNGKDQWFPWIASDPSTGFLVCIFYDSRNFPNNDQAETFVATSTDNGNTWEDFKVSDVSWNADGYPGFASNYAGDYIGIDILNGRVYPVWTDVRAGQLMAWVSPFLLADPTDPNPPSNFDAYSDYTTPTSMALTWDDPTTLANGDTLLPSEFQINILRDDVPLDSVAGGTEQYTDNGLTDGVLYTYTIFTKILTNDSTSLGVNASWTAGGSPIPEKPTTFFITQPDSMTLMMHWTNPADNIDGTPMDDFAGINLYEDGNLATSFSRAPGDTGIADSAAYMPPAGTHQYYVTAFDNESPSKESAASNIAYSPISIPFFDDFPVAGEPNPGYWQNNLCEVTAEGDNPPSSPYVLNLDGDPSGGGDVALLPVDLSGMSGSGIVLAYWWQPQGLGDTPEAGDDSYVDFLNDQGTWVQVRHYIGAPNQPFQQEVIDIASENPGSGATFFHPAFQFRFRNTATVGPYDDWNFDNVFLGLPTADPEMTVTPLAISDTLLVGAVSMHNATVSNQSPLPSTLDYTVTEDPAASWLTVLPTSGTLTSGQSDILDITLDATGLTAGNYATDLIIAGNDPSNPEDTVTVNLVVNNAPDVRIEPDSLFFTLDVNTADSSTFTIFNDGLGPLNFTITDEDVQKNSSNRAVDRSYINPEFNVEIPKDTPDWRKGTPQTEGAGGPDLFGYTWIDSDEPGGPVPNYIDISSTGTLLTWDTGTNDDGRSVRSLPFPVDFYGISYNQITICSNGWIGFDSYAANYLTNTQIPSTTLPDNFIAAFWDDLNGNNPNSAVYYQQIGNKFIIQFHNWNRYLMTGGDYNFQFVLYQSSSTIELQYATMQDGTGTTNSHTIGIENPGGMDGLQVVFNAAYIHNDMAIKFSTESSWLSANPTSGTVAPGSSANIWAVANSSGLLGGTYLANFVVSSNDPIDPSLTKPIVEMTVLGMPDIAVEPDSIVFQSPVVIGTQDTLMLSIFNNGNGVLNVTDIASSNSVFSVSATNFSIPPFDSVSITVAFTPTSPGIESGTLTISSNDPDTPTLIVHVEGEAIDAPAIAVLPDTFDVTLAIDSMTTETMTIYNNGAGPLDFEVVIGGDLPELMYYKFNEVGASQTQNFAAPGSPVPAMANVLGSLTMGNTGYEGAALIGAGASSSTSYVDPGWITNISGSWTISLWLGGTWPASISYLFGDITAQSFRCFTAGAAGVNGLLLRSPNGASYDVQLNNVGPGAAVVDYVYDDAALELRGYVNGVLMATVPQPAPIVLSGTDVFKIGGYSTSGGLAAGMLMDEWKWYTHAIDVESSRAEFWLSADTTSAIIAPGDSMEITLTFDATGLTGGDYEAQILVKSNDPASPEVGIGAHMFVVDSVTSITGLDPLPTTFAISQNYPNPFNPTTTFKYQLPEIAQVKLIVYNILGQKVRTLINRSVEPGYHTAEWDGLNDSGNRVATGLYIYRFQAGKYVKTMKMMMLK